MADSPVPAFRPAVASPVQAGKSARPRPRHHVQAVLEREPVPAPAVRPGRGQPDVPGDQPLPGHCQADPRRKPWPAAGVEPRPASAERSWTSPPTIRAVCEEGTRSSSRGAPLEAYPILTGSRAPRPCTRRWTRTSATTCRPWPRLVTERTR
ncbi:hypothetical protein QJS66_11145 [Kocuria rhizophila]|nr:hypothetical protein QJS66_11145 [Kocuria rhizophila]